MEGKQFRRGMLAGAVMVMIPVAVCIAIFLRYFNGQKVNLPPQTVSKINTVLEMIDEEYLFEYTDEDMEAGILKGIMYGLGDVYSGYYTVKEFNDVVTSTKGNFCGIGVMIRQNAEKGYVDVTDVLEGGSAIEAGIKIGDCIIGVDGKRIPEDVEAATAMDMVKGEAGTKVKLTILRGEEILEFEITRKVIPVISVKYEMKEDKIGYIHLEQFTEASAKQFKDAVDALTEEGMSGLVIDIRNNPGGTLTSVLAITDYLMPEGLIMYEEDKYGRKQEYRSTDAAAMLNVPCVILTNENSASAAEVFSGAMKDNKLATIVGKTTYGKGIVQTLRMLSDGTGLKYTVRHYFTPNGHDIHGVGIKPDIEVDLDKKLYESEGIDSQLEAAVKHLKETM
jgi:carboxyl-terminal processing protease